MGPLILQEKPNKNKWLGSEAREICIRERGAWFLKAGADEPLEGIIKSSAAFADVFRQTVNTFLDTIPGPNILH